MLPAIGQAAEAQVLADENLAAARATGNPLWIAYALAGCGRAFADSGPARALDAYREGLDYCPAPTDRLRDYSAFDLGRDAARVGSD